MTYVKIAPITCVRLPVFVECSAVPTQTERAHGAVCPKCETVWIERPNMNDPYMMSTVQKRDLACPDCESAVKRFFKTGHLEHYCSSCEGTLWYCTTEPELAAQRGADEPAGRITSP
jgi:Zn-finger nucleic acid-binding protein